MPESLAPRLALVAAILALGIAGCGGDGTIDPEGDPVAGEELVAEERVDPSCGSCHTLADAEFTARVAPSLDELRPGYQQVFEAVRDGPGAMPSYSDTLTDEEIHDVAAYVSAATAWDLDEDGEAD